MTQASPSPADAATYGRDLTPEALEELAVNIIRGLAMDGMQKAKSGHPGMPMGMADVAYVLWTKYLRHSPKDPQLAQPRSLRALRRATARCCCTRCCICPGTR